MLLLEITISEESQWRDFLRLTANWARTLTHVYLLMQQLGGPLHNLSAMESLCWNLMLLFVKCKCMGCILWKSDAVFLWLPTRKQNNWNMFIHTYSHHHHISQQTARKRIQRLINVMFTPVMVDTLQYCSMKWNKSINSNIYLPSLHMLSLHISFQMKHNRNVTCNHRNRKNLLHSSSQWLSSNTILYWNTSFFHHHRLMHGMLELNFRLYISATTESSILQKLHVKRVTSVDIRWQ